jgi:hypothetical protein
LVLAFMYKSSYPIGEIIGEYIGVHSDITPEFSQEYFQIVSEGFTLWKIF